MATRLLLAFLRDDLAEEVLGDLQEKFYQTLERGSLFRARLNYTYQVIQYLRPFAIRSPFKKNFTSFIMYKSYFTIGWRNILKNKGYAAINVGGLALAMTVAMLIGLWIYDELSYNKYHENYDSIAKVYRTEKVWNGETYVNTAHVTALGTLLRSSYEAQFKHVVMVRAGVEDRVLSTADKKFTQRWLFHAAWRWRYAWTKDEVWYRGKDSMI